MENTSFVILYNTFKEILKYGTPDEASSFLTSNINSFPEEILGHIVFVRFEEEITKTPHNPLRDEKLIKLFDDYLKGLQTQIIPENTIQVFKYLVHELLNDRSVFQKNIHYNLNKTEEFVLEAIKQLTELELVERNIIGCIYLTPKGNAFAIKNHFK